MVKVALRFILSAALTATISMVLLEAQAVPAAAQSCGTNTVDITSVDTNGVNANCPTPTPKPTPTSTP